MSRLGRMVAVVLVTVTSLSAAGQGGATSATARARALFRQGIAQYDAGELDAALQAFRESYQLHSHRETQYNIAAVLGRLGRYREAIKTYADYLSQAEHVARERRALVVAEMNRLRGQLARLTVKVEPAGAAVSVDGTGVGVAPLAAPVETDPGRHVVEGRLAGHEDGRLEVVLRAGAAEQVALALRPLPALLTFRNAPAGAAISIDGNAVGRHPLAAPVRVRPGAHTVRATAAGYEPVERKFGVAPGEILSLEIPTARLLPLPRLRLRGPQGAVASVEGAPPTTLPWEGEVNAGEVRVTLSGKGMHTWEGTVSTRRGDLLTVDARLGRRPKGPSWRWVWSTAGVTAAAGAVALGLGLKALDVSKQYDRVASAIQAGQYTDLAAEQAHGRSLASESRRYALGCDAALAVAGAGAVAAIIMLILHDSGEAGPAVTFSSRGAPGLGVTKRW